MIGEQCKHDLLFGFTDSLLVFLCVLQYITLTPYTSCLIQLSGSRRLQDAIVLGYQLQRVSGKDIDVPSWYALAQDELSFRIPSADETSTLTRE